MQQFGDKRRRASRPSCNMIDDIIAEIDKRIDEIESDSRFQQDTASVQINAPLALIQQDMTAELRGLRRARGACTEAE